MGYGKPLGEITRHSGVEQVTEADRVKREAQEAKEAAEAPKVPEADPNTVVTANVQKRAPRSRGGKGKGKTKQADK